jgi:preprotein translocase subunit YajC
MSSLVAAPASSGGSGSLLIYGLLVLLIGFMFITQRRRAKESQRVQSTLSVGDEVMTTSGLLGRITGLDDQIATLEVSPGVRLRFNRRAIAGPAPASSPSPTATPNASPTASASSEPDPDMPSDPTRLND